MHNEQETPLRPGELPDKSGHYECALCGGVFKFDWSYEEALKEAREKGFTDENDWAIVCDDCYNKIMP